MGFCGFRYLCVFAFVFSVFCFFVFPVSAVGSNVPTDFKSIQLKVPYVPGLEDPDIFFWPHLSRNKSPFGETSPIDVFFVGKTRAEVLDFFSSRGLHGAFIMKHEEYGYRGPDLAHMSWNTADHVEDTDTKNPEFNVYLDDVWDWGGIGGRYHLVLFEGGYSKKFKANWCYGNVHYDFIELSVPPWHALHKRSCDYGVEWLKSKLDQKTDKLVGGKCGWCYYFVDFDNGNGHCFTDGRSLLVVFS